MNISKKYNAISCSEELINKRFSNIISRLNDPQLIFFRLKEWDYNVGKPNKGELTKLIKEYADNAYYYIGDNWSLDYNISDSDFVDDTLLIILYDSDSFGLVTICEDNEDLSEALSDLVNVLLYRSVPVTGAPKEQSTEIKQMTFYDYFKNI